MKIKNSLVIVAILLMVLNVGFAAKATTVKNATAPKSASTKKTTTAKTTTPKPYPTGCKQVGFGFSNGVLVLEPYHKNIEQKQVVYFIQNTSKQEILFSDQQDPDAPYIMHHNNTLKPDQWAVFAADKITRFICSNNNKIQTLQSIVDCENTIKVCEYANVKFALNNRGNYWAATNLSMSGAVTEIIHQGVLLKS